MERRWHQRTGETAAVVGLCVKIFPMADHAGAQMRDRQSLLLVVAFTALGDGLDVGSHGFVDAINALRRMESVAVLGAAMIDGSSHRHAARSFRFP